MPGLTVYFYNQLSGTANDPDNHYKLVSKLKPGKSILPVIPGLAIAGSLALAIAIILILLSVG